MKIVFDIRISDPRILKQLPADLGVDLMADSKFLPDGSIGPYYSEIRKILISKDDQRFGLLHKVLSRYPDGEYSVPTDRRHYTKKELEKAELFQVFTRANPIFEPCSEIYDDPVIYDETNACKHCGIGREQIADLVLAMYKASKNRDVTRTITHEWAISKRFADLMKQNKITGYKLRPIRNKKGVANNDWFHLVITSPPVPVAPETRFGIDEFNKDKKEEKEYICPEGHVKGLNLLSEVFVPREKWHGMDIGRTLECSGKKMGYLMPHPAILASPRLLRIMKENKINGFQFEVAYLV